MNTDLLHMTERNGSQAVKLSIVVPCFNEEETLIELCRRARLAAASAVDESFEIILVDDGSTDTTWSIIVELASDDPRIVGIKLSRNYGHQFALTAGLRLVGGDYVLVLDADLQDPPELLTAMLDVMERQTADVVYGQRIIRHGETLLKRGASSLFYRMFRWSTDVQVPIDVGDFRLMTRRVSDLVSSMPERDRFIRGMVAWLGFKQVAFAYEREGRFAGTTKYTWGKMLRFATDAFLGYSMVLLRVAIMLAMTLLLVLLLMAAYSLYAWMFLGAVPGWTSTTMLIILVTVCQLLVLSVIGEYVGRIYIEVKRRPLYVVEKIVRKQP